VIILEEWSRNAARTLESLAWFLGLPSALSGPPMPAQRRYSEVRAPLVRHLFGTQASHGPEGPGIPRRLLSG